MRNLKTVWQMRIQQIPYIRRTDVVRHGYHEVFLLAFDSYRQWIIKGDFWFGMKPLREPDRNSGPFQGPMEYVDQLKMSEIPSLIQLGIRNQEFFKYGRSLSCGWPPVRHFVVQPIVDYWLDILKVADTALVAGIQAAILSKGAFKSVLPFRGQKNDLVTWV